MNLAITPGRLLVLKGNEKLKQVSFKPSELDEKIKKTRKEYGKAEVKNYSLQFLSEKTGQNQGEYLKKLTQFCMELTQARMKEKVKRDELIIQAVNTIQDMNKELNFLTSRIREWYGLTDPESTEKIDDHEKLVHKITQKPEKTLFGLEIEKEDEKMIKTFAEFIKRNYKLKSRIEKYTENLMEQIAPNLEALLGPILGAQLIAKAGGLYDLAIMPGSTIQVLGAEKALFRHLIKGTPSPKHGLIFQHPTISSNPKKIRGRVARSLAAKIAIAARLDYYGKGVNEELINDFEKRVEALKK